MISKTGSRIARPMPSNHRTHDVQPDHRADHWPGESNRARPVSASANLHRWAMGDEANCPRRQRGCACSRGGHDRTVRQHLPQCRRYSRPLPDAGQLRSDNRRQPGSLFAPGEHRDGGRAQQGSFCQQHSRHAHHQVGAIDQFQRRLRLAYEVDPTMVVPEFCKLVLGMQANALCRRACPIPPPRSALPATRCGCVGRHRPQPVRL